MCNIVHWEMMTEKNVIVVITITNMYGFDMKVFGMRLESKRVMNNVRNVYVQNITPQVYLISEGEWTTLHEQ